MKNGISTLICLLLMAVTTGGLTAQTELDFSGEARIGSLFNSYDLPRNDTEGASLCAPEYFAQLWVLRELQEGNITEVDAGAMLPNWQITSPCSSREGGNQAEFVFDLEIKSDRVDLHSEFQIGTLTMGRSQTVGGVEMGPASGGLGDGQVNLQTGNLYLLFHDIWDELTIQAGFFDFASPRNLLYEQNRGGVSLISNFKEYSSEFELAYSVHENNLFLNIDSNQFSDRNRSPNAVGMFGWKYYEPDSPNMHFYVMTFNDNDHDNPTNALLEPYAQRVLYDENDETSTLSWLGLVLNIPLADFELTFHGVLQSGSFQRPLEEELDQDTLFLKALEAGSPVLWDDLGESVYWTQFRKNYGVFGGAGEIELSYSISDEHTWTLAAVGASGRYADDLEPDGGSPDYRRDQFRTAEGEFDFSGDLDFTTAVATDELEFLKSNLAGTFALAFRYRYEPDQKLGFTVVDFLFSTYRLNHQPTIDQNLNFTRYGPYELNNLIRAHIGGEIDLFTLDVSEILNEAYIRENLGPGKYILLKEPSIYLGDEYSVSFKYNILESLALSGGISTFVSQDGYNAIRDVMYGRRFMNAEFVLEYLF